MTLKKNKVQGKKLREESDLTIWNEYRNLGHYSASWREILFWIFMIVLYYSGYARWFFWTLVGMIGFVMLVDVTYNWKIQPYNKVIRKEMVRRGFKE